MTGVTDSERIGPYTIREWRIAALVFFSYIAVFLIMLRLLPDAAIVPAYGIAIAGIFFGGVRLWPVVFLSAIIAGAISRETSSVIMVTSAAALFQALLAGYLLKRWQVDPIFRRDKDAVGIVGALCLVSLIAPSLFLFRSLAYHLPVSPEMWIYDYVATLFSLIFATPFLLRWPVKPLFTRTPAETMEISGVFILLLLINIIFYIVGPQYLFGMPVIYLLLIPFFFISLRLRPRFVTLAVFVTALFAIASFVLSAGDAGLPMAMFWNELFLTILAVNFLIVSALEEHRRSSAGKFYTQVASLENAMARLSSESQAKNDFIAILAHELRNPLTPVLSGIELLRLRASDEEARTVLDSMNDSMNTVKVLLNDLLDVSRISEGKMSLKKKRIDIEPVLNSAIVATAHHRKERHQQFVLKSPDKPLFVIGDPIRIEQVFSNLLTNASKYSNEGDVITIRIKEEDKWVSVEVEDQGVGIKKEALESIFEPFHQIEQGERTQEGLGIGLSLVRDLISMHSGTARAESDGINKGSRFIVQLPLDKPK